MSEFGRAGPSTSAQSLGEALALANRYRNQGRLTEAEELCRRAIVAQPNLAEAEHLLGLVAHQRGRLGTAIEHVGRAIELAPKIALFHANLGEMLRLAGRPRDAAESARRAVALDPNMALALSNLGVALYELKEFEEAAEVHRQATTASPDFAEAHSNLGNALHALGRYDEAIAAYRRALELKPDFADALANLGTTLHHSGIFADAVARLRHAIAVAPQHANAHAGLGILLLMRGEFGEGWDEYEWRLRSSERIGPQFPERPWQGESLIGKHIYVQAEQGFRHTLQFARYVPLLAGRAGSVTLRVRQQLVTLLAASLPGITVLGEADDPRPFACDAALLSLPRLLRTRLETIPASVPYLRSPPEAAQRWQAKLAPLRHLRVGIVWAGNADHANHVRRSLDLAQLEPLFAVPGTSFVSLQVGEQSGELEKLRSGQRSVQDLAPHLTDFAETAGAVTALDLVIAVDTAVAHLAGALGKPSWVLLPSVTEWRWLLGREDSPWYPAMRLYRQEPGQKWAEIVHRVAADLQAVAEGDEAPLMPFKAKGERGAAYAATIITAEAKRATMPGAMGSRDRLTRDELARLSLVTEPDNAEALHTLALVAHQSGKLQEAIEHLRRAVTLRPEVPLYHANLGEMCRMAGQVDEAIAEGTLALEIEPGNATVHSNLGIALFDQGKFEAALVHYRKAIALRPDFAQPHSNCGNALQRLKRFTEALPYYRRAAELQPAFADAWYNLGTCLRQLGRLDESESAYRKALELQPNNPDFLDSLALALKDLERLDEAAEVMRRAIVLDQTRDAFYTHFATILIDREEFDEAEAAVRRALALNPNSHDAANQMGRVAFKRGDLKTSLVHYRHALSLNPDLADAYNNMGNSLRELGRLEEAGAAFVDALRRNPKLTGTYVRLADSMTFVSGSPYLAEMESLAATPHELSKTDRMQLGFALGKAYADLEDYRRSFACLRDANAIKRAMVTYDESAAMQFFDRIEAAFTPQLFHDRAGSGDRSPRPIFVIGMPRSGTTLVEQILASHPAVHGAGELPTFDKVAGSVSIAGAGVVRFPEFVSAIDAATFRQIGRRYLAELQKIGPGDQRVTDKMPSNYYYAGLIHLALPNAKIVHCVRDPVDTCVSCFSKLFSSAQVHTYDLGELGRYYRRYQRLMAHWQRVLPRKCILEVHYEHVVADLEGQARRVLAYCGLPWDERCLSFHRTERPIRTASASQVRRPIYQFAVGRWRAYAEDLDPLLDALEIKPDVAYSRRSSRQAESFRDST